MIGLLSAGLIVWTYAGYPFLIEKIAKFIKKRVNEKRITPNVTIIVPTYNEERVIKKRLENIAELNYAKEKIEVLVVDSGSKDKTAEIAKKEIKKQGINGRVIVQKERKGKASAINEGIRNAKGEIIVVTDANDLFDKNAIKNIVKPFADENVGGVGGKFSTVGKAYVGRGMSAYWGIEDRMRKAESDIYSMLNFSGEINAFRKGIVSFDEKSLTEDFDATLQIVEKGYRVIYKPDAVIYEPTIASVEDLITQKKRIAKGSIKTIFKHWRMFPNQKLFAFNFMLVSHKLLRYLTPFLLFLCLLDIEYLPLLVGMGIIGIIALSLMKKRIVSVIKYIPFWFMVQYAYLLAWVELAMNRYDVRWKKTETSRDMETIEKISV